MSEESNNNASSHASSSFLTSNNDNDNNDISVSLHTAMQVMDTILPHRGDGKGEDYIDEDDIDEDDLPEDNDADDDNDGDGDGEGGKRDENDKGNDDEMEVMAEAMAVDSQTAAGLAFVRMMELDNINSSVVEDDTTEVEEKKVSSKSRGQRLRELAMPSTPSVGGQQATFFDSIRRRGGKANAASGSLAANWAGKGKGGRQRLSELQPAQSRTMGEATRLYTTGNFTESIQLCGQVVGENPHSPMPYSLLATIHEEQGNMQVSLIFQMTALALDSTGKPEDWRELALRWVDIGEIEHAYQCMQKAMSKRSDPYRPEWGVDRALLLMQLGDERRALPAFQKVLAAWPANLDIAARVAYLQISRNRHSLGAEALRGAMEANDYKRGGILDDGLVCEYVDAATANRRLTSGKAALIVVGKYMLANNISVPSDALLLRMTICRVLTKDFVRAEADTKTLLTGIDIVEHQSPLFHLAETWVVKAGPGPRPAMLIARKLRQHAELNGPRVWMILANAYRQRGKLQAAENLFLGVVTKLTEDGKTNSRAYRDAETHLKSCRQHCGTISSSNVSASIVDMDTASTRTQSFSFDEEFKLECENDSDEDQRPVHPLGNNTSYLEKKPVDCTELFERLKLTTSIPDYIELAVPIVALSLLEVGTRRSMRPEARIEDSRPLAACSLYGFDINTIETYRTARRHGKPPPPMAVVSPPSDFAKHWRAIDALLASSAYSDGRAVFPTLRPRDIISEALRLSELLLDNAKIINNDATHAENGKYCYGRVAAENALAIASITSNLIVDDQQSGDAISLRVVIIRALIILGDPATAFIKVRNLKSWSGPRCHELWTLLNMLLRTLAEESFFGIRGLHDVSFSSQLGTPEKRMKLLLKQRLLSHEESSICDDPRMYTSLGHWAAVIGEHDEAVKMYMQAVRCNPDDAWLNLLLGLAYVQCGVDASLKDPKAPSIIHVASKKKWSNKSSKRAARVRSSHALIAHGFAFINRYVKLSKEAPLAIYNAAISLLRIGLKGSAVTLLKRILASAEKGAIRYQAAQTLSILYENANEPALARQLRLKECCID